MRIIGGIVAYEDGVKTITGDQFSPTRKVRVELNFSLDDADEGDDAVILAVLNKAQSFVQGKLNLDNPTAAATKTVRLRKAAETPADPASVASGHEAAVAAVAKSSAATAKVLTDKDRLAAAGGLVPGAEPAKEKPAADPAAIEDAVVEEDDGLGDLMGGGEAPVTDKDLTDAVQTKNKEIKDPVRIRELVFSYNGGPGHEIKDIPPTKRHEFLGKLKALVKA